MGYTNSHWHEYVNNDVFIVPTEMKKNEKNQIIKTPPHKMMSFNATQHNAAQHTTQQHNPTQPNQQHTMKDREAKLKHNQPFVG